MPPKKPAIGADGRADQKRKEDADHRDLQIDARAPDDARENIAAEIVGAEGMQKGRRPEDATCGVLQDRIVGRDQEARRSPAGEKQQYAGADGKREPLAEEPAPAERGGDRLHAHSFTLGSAATVTMSAMKLTSTVAQAKTMATPCTTI